MKQKRKFFYLLKKRELNIRDYFFILLVISCSVDEKNLKFSTTQEWDREILKFSKTSEVIMPLEKWEEILKVKPPPSESKIIKEEIEYLLDLEKKRTQSDVKKIIDEVFFVAYGKYGLQREPLTRKKYRYLKEVLNIAHTELARVLVYYKKKFDRVRPSFYDKRLNVAIKVPGHPSYPSAHAAQAFMVAEVLAFVNPKGRSRYREYAEQISFHRELAGLHYPSDSRAGKILGVNFAHVLMYSKQIKNLIGKTKKLREMKAEK